MINLSQINPNSSRIGKLKKLFHISSELISEFGLLYFLRVAFIELFKQRGKLFSPDNVSDEIKNEFITNYDDFLKNHFLKISSYSSKISNFSIQPFFSLVLFVDQSSPPLKKIFTEQIYKNFEFILVSSTNKHVDSYVKENNISNFKKLILDVSKINDILSISDSDYFVFFDNYWFFISC